MHFKWLSILLFCLSGYAYGLQEAPNNILPCYRVLIHFVQTHPSGEVCGGQIPIWASGVCTPSDVKEAFKTNIKQRIPCFEKFGAIGLYKTLYRLKWGLLHLSLKEIEPQDETTPFNQLAEQEKYGALTSVTDNYLTKDTVPYFLSNPGRFECKIRDQAVVVKKPDESPILASLTALFCSPTHPLYRQVRCHGVTFYYGREIPLNVLEAMLVQIYPDVQEEKELHDPSDTLYLDLEAAYSLADIHALLPKKGSVQILDWGWDKYDWRWHEFSQGSFVASQGWMPLQPFRDLTVGVALGAIPVWLVKKQGNKNKSLKKVEKKEKIARIPLRRTVLP